MTTTLHNYTLFLSRRFFWSPAIKQTCGQAFRWLSAQRNVAFLLAGLVATVLALASVAVRAAKEGGVKVRPGNFSAASPAVVPIVPKVAMGTNIVVNSTADGTLAALAGNSTCDLREAIQAANTNTAVGGANGCPAGMAGMDTITFSVTGTITISSVLPTITEPVTIDGFQGANTCPASGLPAPATMQVILNGNNNNFDGLTFNVTSGTGPSIVRGLVIRNFRQDGIQVNTTNAANFLTCQCNYIGTAADGVTGTTTNRNSDNGIEISSSPNNIIERNLISNNGSGLLPPIGSGVAILNAGATGNIVRGNYIGTDVNGTADLGNNTQGVNINNAPNNTIGGTLAAERNVISGNNANGVLITGASAMGNNVRGNYIGLAADGTTLRNNILNGVSISGAANNIIGGAATGAGNVISGNGFGIVGNGVEMILAGTTGNQVLGNYIGTDATGTLDRGNVVHGVNITGLSGNFVGGINAGEGNVISGNGVNGVQLTGGGASNNSVRGNYIGTNAAGTAAIQNGAFGIGILAAAHDNTIGGTTTAARNVISGNAGDGIQINAALSNSIIGNYIGTNAAGTGALANGDDGVDIQLGSTGNMVGGTATGAGNLIANNTSNGVEINALAGTTNSVLGNSITANGALGIDLSTTGVTLNDPDDPDTGANNRQNFPVLTCAVSSGSQTTVRGTLDSLASTDFRIEFFANTACDASGYGEGQTLLGAVNVTTDANGDAMINATLPVAVAAGSSITATATRLNLGNPAETSEFSQCLASFAPTLTINDVSVMEGNAGMTALNFTVTLAGAQGLACPVTVNFATANGTATIADNDYAMNAGLLTFNAPIASNSVTQTVTVQVNGDTTVEANETFFVNLTNATLATITDAQGQGTITNDDSATIAINDVSVTEGNAGTTNTTFNVTLSNPSAEQVTVNFTTANNTATAGSDYNTNTSSVVFPANSTAAQTITVQVVGDTTVEANETFFVNLTSISGTDANVPNPTFADDQGQGTINNDDSATVAINDVSVSEGNAGTTNATFNVTLSNPSAEQVTVNFTTANNTATAGSDYNTNTSSVVFPANSTAAQTITVQVVGDTTVEANETFFVNLTSISGTDANVPNPTFADDQGQGTITNDDNATIAINNVSVIEGNAGTVAATFNVTLSNPGAEQVTVNFATANDTATAGSDYNAASGTLTFAPGVISQPVTVQVVGDTTVEANETFFVNLTSINGTDANVPDPTFADNQGLGTITNDDSAAIAINDVTVTEGNTGTTSATFNVTLSNPSAEQVTVNFATANNTATTGSDFVAANGTVTFAPGVTLQTITVQVNGDTALEPNETYLVNLSNIVGNNAAVPDPTFADATGQGTILDDDLLRASLSDPLSCTGPGNVVNGLIQVTNPNAAPQSFSLTTTFTNLVGLPNTCSLTGAQVGATCVVTAGGLTASGTVAGNTTVNVQFQAQVADAINSGTVSTSSVTTVGAVTSTPVVASLAVNCPVVGPGLLAGGQSQISDQQAGSVLFYNLYSSSIAAPNSQNTRIAITNTHPSLPVAVHLFFVDGATCSIADSLICLTAQQTASFLASDIDPGTTGYIVAVASDSVTGCPINFNYLIGDAYVKLSSGHAANLAAEGFAALAGGLPTCDASSVTTILNFDGVSYNRAPRVLAASNIPARSDGNDTLLVLNRVGGSLVTGAATLSSLFGIIYDDAENPLSFTFSTNTCQFRSSLSDNFPRLAPRFQQFIPAGRSGWAKFYSLSENVGLLGAQLNYNPNAATAANAFNQGHNLHKLTLTTSTQLTIPIFPPNC
jgi:CSLREA domain-containing protein